MPKIPVRYRLTRRLQERVFSETGRFPLEVDTVKIEIGRLTPEERSRLAGFIDETGTLQIFHAVAWICEPYYRLEFLPCETGILTDRDLVAVVDALLAEREKAIEEGKAQHLSSVQEQLTRGLNAFRLALKNKKPHETAEYAYVSAADLAFAEASGVSTAAFRMARDEYKKAFPSRRVPQLLPVVSTPLRRPSSSSEPTEPTQPTRRRQGEQAPETSRPKPKPRRTKS